MSMMQGISHQVKTKQHSLRHCEQVKPTAFHRVTLSSQLPQQYSDLD